jgi:hypothetical protein
MDARIVGVLAIPVEASTVILVSAVKKWSMCKLLKIRTNENSEKIEEEQTAV